ncbi:acyltransferase [Psychrobacter sp. F1192]|uniref:Acyltransferase n=1 Tax=Psychrobacter coccoides TaxID=2818440 RepID=A0ABS3NMU3_9GAMM|nr:acyltransferase family protein [Psychrobacter coccoides]MBO1530737.1 acyltransferase [Psychrobacter coccoides]
MFEKYTRQEYRNDIQGLRAIGAIIIMVFHIWFNKVSGGVDVFFVISGFLMASIVLKGYFTKGTVSPFPFWGGVIKRIAPSAYLVLAATLVASYFITSPVQIYSVLHEIIASALHLENIQLIRLSVDYLATGTPPSPVQQFWALSIQMQFYVVFPLVLIPLAYLTKKRQNSAPLFLGVGAIILASFIYATVLVQSDAAMSYFNPLSRIWEFFFGSLSYLVIANVKRIRHRQIIGIVGIALIIGGAILIPRGANFSGPISLIPVLGAVAIIVSGIGGKGVVNNFLSNKFLVFLGGISFTIYLWHWPILVFYKEYFGHDTVGLLPGFAIMIVSTILAYFTSKLIEAPFRKIPREKVILNFSIGALFFLPVVAAAFAFRYEVVSTTAKAMEMLAAAPTEPFAGERLYLEDQRFIPERDRLLTIKKRVPAAYADGCNQSMDGEEVTTCEFGDPNADKQIVLAGGSHAVQWITALDEIGKNNNFKVINMTKAACPLGPVEDSNDSCYKWNESALKEIVAINPYAVITNSTRTDLDKGEFIPETYIDSWRQIDANGIKVIGIRDNPRFDFDVPDCIHRNRNSAETGACTIDRSDILLPTDPATEYQDIITSIDMSDMFCTAEKCPTTFSGKIMYRDAEHISIEYAHFIKDNFEEKLKAVLLALD